MCQPTRSAAGFCHSAFPPPTSPPPSPQVAERLLEAVVALEDKEAAQWDALMTGGDGMPHCAPRELATPRARIYARRHGAPSGKEAGTAGRGECTHIASLLTAIALARPQMR